jgi:hypothetical protein
MAYASTAKAPAARFASSIPAAIAWNCRRIDRFQSFQWFRLFRGLERLEQLERLEPDGAA